MLAQVNRIRGRNPQAIAHFQRALRAAELSDRRLPEGRYRVALALAEQYAQRPVAVEFARHLVAAYPNPTNWRDALLVFRTVGTIDPAQNLDAMRLMAMATALDQAALPGEVKAVLDEGIAQGMIVAADAAPKALLASASQRITRERAGLTGRITQARGAAATGEQARTTADALFGYGRYADAAELYRLALARAGEDPNLLNTRLGASLALAGQKSEAEAALRTVTGPRAELAGLWLAWLARPAA
jgi:tetratricopeptide (TPR) repeat protein